MSNGLSDNAIQQVMLSEPLPEAVIRDVSNRLVHAHASIHMVFPRVGLPMAADGVRHELNAIGDDMLDMHAMLEAVLERLSEEL